MVTFMGPASAITSSGKKRRERSKRAREKDLRLSGSRKEGDFPEDTERKSK